MHELFAQVLGKRDLSKAGDLFSIDDHIVSEDLKEVIVKVEEITRSSEYRQNANDQSVVEICITRVTSAIRETNSIEKHAEPLIFLLESCLSHSLAPTGKDEDPPHTKIASDVLACVFRHYNKREVMKLALPVAVKFLHKGNRDLSRNLASYLSLAAIGNADLLSQHIQPMIDSVISGNYTLAKVLPQMYPVNNEAVHDHIMALASLLPLCDTQDKAALLTLLRLVAKSKPALLESSVPQLCDCLTIPSCVSSTLQLLLDVSSPARAPWLAEHWPRVREAVQKVPAALPLAAQLVSRLGQLSLERAQNALDFITSHLHDSEPLSLHLLLKEIQSLCAAFPSLQTEPLMERIGLILEAPTTPQAARNICEQLQSSYHPKNASSSMVIKIGGSGSIAGSSELSQPAMSTLQMRPPPSYLRSSLGTLVNVNLPLTVLPGQSGNTQGVPVLLSLGSVPNRGVGNSCGSRMVGSRPKHADASRSTPRLTGGVHSTRAMNRSTSWLNAVHINGRANNPSPGPGAAPPSSLHKSMTRLGSSSHAIGLGPAPLLNPSPVTHGPGIHNPHVTGTSVRGMKTGSKGSLAVTRVTSGGVTVTTSSGTQSPLRSKSGSLSTMKEHQEIERDRPSSILGPIAGSAETGLNFRTIPSAHPPVNLPLPGLSISLSPSPFYPIQPSPPPAYSPLHIPLEDRAAIEEKDVDIKKENGPRKESGGNLGVVMRRPHTSVTMITHGYANGNDIGTSQRISVFEPFPMRDTIQHFCEKHLDKIKAYIERLTARLPLPAKCTIEERKAKKHAKVHFACQGKGEHCLYSKAFFALKTRHPRLWIHLMFLALQARSLAALSTRDTSVSSLKNCWDILKCDNKTFLTLVTSAFPSAKDQDNLLQELQQARFFDVFEFNGPLQQWNCFLCNHPERAAGFLEENNTLMEGQLKEKKSKWVIFRKWRPRYFTLSGAHLSYRGSNDPDVTPIEINRIRSVKVGRSGRTIPKAFEIFTGDKTYVLKAKDGKNAEEWVQCLSIAVASSHVREVGSTGTSNKPPQPLFPSATVGLRTSV